MPGLASLVSGIPFNVAATAFVLVPSWPTVKYSSWSTDNHLAAVIRRRSSLEDVQGLWPDLERCLGKLKIAQRRHKHCGLAVVKWSSATDAFLGARDGQNLISWRWSLPSPTNPVWWGLMHAILNYRGNRHTHTHKETAPITIHCATATTLTLFGHIARIDDNVDAKQILTSSPSVYWKRPPGRPGWRRCRATSTPTGCHGPTQSTWPRTTNSGGCWQLVALRTRSGASRRRRQLARSVIIWLSKLKCSSSMTFSTWCCRSDRAESRRSLWHHGTWLSGKIQGYWLLHFMLNYDFVVAFLLYSNSVVITWHRSNIVKAAGRFHQIWAWWPKYWSISVHKTNCSNQ